MRPEINSILIILQSLEKTIEEKDLVIKGLSEQNAQLLSKVWLFTEALSFFDRIPQAKPKVNKLREQLKAIDSNLNQ